MRSPSSTSPKDGKDEVIDVEDAFHETSDLHRWLLLNGSTSQVDPLYNRFAVQVVKYRILGVRILIYRDVERFLKSPHGVSYDDVNAREKILSVSYKSLTMKWYVLRVA